MQVEPFSQPQKDAEPHDGESHFPVPAYTRLTACVTLRSVLVAIALTLLSGLWVRQSEILVLATQITESVPTIPALAALALLLIVNGLLRLQKRIHPLTSGEILFVFLFVAISTMISGIGVVQLLFSLLATPFYYFKEEGAPLRTVLPRWLVPNDIEVIRRLFEGAPDGRVPWELWIRPGLFWLAFFGAFGWTLHCLMALFYRAWAEDEKLAFPLVSLPIEMMGDVTQATSFFRNRLMWFGFSLAAFYNGVNILHAFSPAYPAFGKELNLGQMMTELPLSAIAPFSLHFRPELIGLGYLISTEISFTIWFSYLVLKLGAVFSASLGYLPNHLYPMEQGIGAYLALALFFVWMARHRLAGAFRAALAGEKAAGPEGMRSRTALCGVVAGSLFCWLFMWLAGMVWWTAGFYLLLVLAVALVYGRMRAQTGVPMVWLYPYEMPKSVLLYTFGTAPFLSHGPTNMAVWVLFTVVGKGYFHTVGAFQIESMELTRRSRSNPRYLAFGLLCAVLLGFAMGWYHHLVPYYLHGAVHLRDGDIWGGWYSRPEFDNVLQAMEQPRFTETTKVIASASGAVITAVLSLLRLRFTGFPLSPLGYAMTCCFGDVLWAPFLLVWGLKSLALRYGGMGYYRQTIPFFLGFALGHLAIAGIFWGIVGALNSQATQGYPVFFG